VAWWGCFVVYGLLSLGLAQGVIMLADIAENEIRTLNLECQADGPAGAGLPDLGRALDALHAKFGVSQILSRQVQGFLDSLPVLG